MARVILLKLELGYGTRKENFMKVINSNILNTNQIEEVGDFACVVACGAFCIILGVMGSAIAQLASSI